MRDQFVKTFTGWYYYDYLRGQTLKILYSDTRDRIFFKPQIAVSLVSSIIITVDYAKGDVYEYEFTSLLRV